MSQGLTFDTGALIALEARRLRMRKVVATAAEEALVITVPMPVIGEWWRGPRTKRADQILQSVDIESLTLELTKQTGEAMAQTRGDDFVDALVMASASRRGDRVYTSDYDDLSAYLELFPEVRLFKV
ncbi:MAG: PIN domain-containing protein [Proteobacteria bacterium]|nr:PIN domain-containing protein [Pseudomonadota bacterium]